MHAHTGRDDGVVSDLRVHLAPGVRWNVSQHQVQQMTLASWLANHFGQVEMLTDFLQRVAFSRIVGGVSKPLPMVNVQVSKNIRSDGIGLKVVELIAKT